MKSYKLVYKPEHGEKRFLFTNVDMKDLSSPVVISREKPVQEEVVFNTKKKSEQVEYEDEEYKKLKEKEGCLLVLEDAENRAYSGKMQDLGASSSCYFVFINTGTCLKVVPVRKWYRFSQRSQLDIIQEYDGEGAGDENGGGDAEGASSEEREEIDFDDDFDDDDGEETNVFVVREKRLNSAGRRMRNIMESYEEKEESESSEEAGERDTKDAEKASRVLTKDALRNMFRGGRIALRDLLRGIKARFGLNEEEKELVKEFIGENCTFETDGGSKERYLVLKK